MTHLDVSFRYAGSPGESEMRAIDAMREVYGIRKITFDEKEHIVRVEFDASRMKEPAVAALLRSTGMDVQEKLTLA